jgi:hypothetical protein
MSGARSLRSLQLAVRRASGIVRAILWSLVRFDLIGSGHKAVVLTHSREPESTSLENALIRVLQPQPIARAARHKIHCRRHCGSSIRVRHGS